jgi:hypothetical protein
MASQFPHVRPGDVISADLLNMIIDKLAELEGKIGTGGGGGTPSQIITGLDPAIQQAAGQPLTLIGTFDFPLNGNTVSIGGISIPSANLLPGSDASHLIFNIPVTLLGPVTIRVRRASNQQEGVREAYLVTPELQGTVPSPTLNADSSGAPNPSLFTDATQVARTGQKAKLVGTNLTQTASLLLKVQVGQGAFVNYPDAQTGKPAAVIDTANTTGQQLVFTVPTITEISAGGFPATVIYEVTVPGAANKASINGRVIRVS